MTDQNNLARGYSSDVSEEDPLAELARIVSGQEPVVRKPAAPSFQQPASQPVTREARPAPEAPAFAARQAVPVQASAAVQPSAPVQRAAATPVKVEAPAFDLEDALMAELGFGETPAAAKPAARVAEPQTVAPVMAAAVAAPIAVSLEDQLLAELSFEEESFAPAPVVHEAPAIVAEEAAFETEDPQSEWQSEEPQSDWQVEEPVDEPVEEIAEEPYVEAESFQEELVEAAPAAHFVPEPPVVAKEQPATTIDAVENEYDELAAILQELSQPQPAATAEEDDYREEYFAEEETAEPAADPLMDLDFGSAFEAELRQMEEVAPVAAAASAVSVRKPHVSLATPVVPRREPASERELEDHFAAAFAQELDMGVSRAMEHGERKPQAPARSQPQPQPVTRLEDEFELDASGPDDVQDWQPEDWDDQFAKDPGHDGDHADLGIAAMVPRTGMRSRGFKLAAGALGVALLVCGGAIAVAFTGGGGEIASGEPKIVKADTTPVKVKPENPGGLEIANQDQVVYDKVAGEKGAGSQEKLVSAAEEPIAIANVAEEDPAAAADGEEQMASTSDAADMPADDAAAMPADAKADARLAPVADEVSPTLPALAPRRVKTMLIKPDGTVVPAPEQTASIEPAALAPQTQATEAAKPIASAATVEPAQAAEPEPAPAAVEANAVQAEAQAPAETKLASAQPSDASAITGEWAVQLASQRSAEDAQATFQNLKSKFPGVLGDKPLAVQRAEVEGKGVFYRVRVPAQTKDEAVALCEQLKAAGGSCFIAR